LTPVYRVLRAPSTDFPNSLSRTPRAKCDPWRVREEQRNLLVPAPVRAEGLERKLSAMPAELKWYALLFVGIIAVVLAGFFVFHVGGAGRPDPSSVASSAAETVAFGYGHRLDLLGKVRIEVELRCSAMETCVVAK